VIVAGTVVLAAVAAVAAVAVDAAALPVVVNAPTNRFN
jgi:hypothetical protein